MGGADNVILEGENSMAFVVFILEILLGLAGMVFLFSIVRSISGIVTIIVVLGCSLILPHTIIGDLDDIKLNAANTMQILLLSFIGGALGGLLCLPLLPYCNFFGLGRSKKDGESEPKQEGGLYLYWRWLIHYLKNGKSKN